MLIRPAAGVLALVAAATALLVPASPATAGGCAPWRQSQVFAESALLENLAFDGQGGMLVSEGSIGGNDGALIRLTPSGTRSVVARATSPGGIVVDGGTAYFTSGNGLASGFFGIADGAINTVDLATGATGKMAGGLVMPNGMVRLPGGDFVVSRDLGGGSMTRVTPSGTATPFAPATTSTNGMAVDVARNVLYVDSTFDFATVINVIDLAHPNATPRKIPIPGFGPLNSADDLTLGADGNLYVALNLAGRVIRVSPDTGAICTLVTGLPFVSSVRFGNGPGWDPQSLYATSFTGTVTRLRP